MTIKDIWQVLFDNRATIGWVVVIAGTIIQITPIKINPWSWLFRTIGNALNTDMVKKFEENTRKIDELREDLTMLNDAFDMMEAKEARYRILRFDDELLMGERHSKEHFDQLLVDIDIYEKYCMTHPKFPNNRCVMAMVHIKEIYKQCVAKNDFLTK